jgi:glyoxylase I family protein
MIHSAFSHIGISATNPEKLESFYVSYFGFKRARVYDTGQEQIVMLKKDNIYFEIFKSSQPRPYPTPEQTGPLFPCFRHVSFMVDDLDESLENLKDVATITHGPADLSHLLPGMKAVWIADPEGNIIELLQGYYDDDK